MNTQNGNGAGTNPMTAGQMPPVAQIPTASYAPTYPSAPVVAPGAGYAQPSVVKASSTFSKTSIAFVVMGLVLLGASIVPLVVYFDMPRAYGVLAFDALLMLGSLGCSILGFAHSSRTMRYAGLAIAIGTISKMLLIDAWSLDSLTKAIAYIVAAVTCVTIGVLYSMAAKRAEKQE